jgi:Na+-transporting methylmalonyl-CoA/oxaloacetate decarboxylase gamma subunit
MILGMSTHAFTLLHVIVSLLAIASGAAVLGGLLTNRLYRRWNSLFLITASLTDITGFAFPNTHITPGIVVGVLSLLALVVAGVAPQVRRLHGVFRGTFVVCTTVALYFEVFVLVAQLFRHIPLLAALSPGGQGLTLAVAQLLVLVVFTWLGTAAFRRFTTGSIDTPNVAVEMPLAGE